jgi:phage repressor protein C with HTH and peptisase S24 domain
MTHGDQPDRDQPDRDQPDRDRKEGRLGLVRPAHWAVVVVRGRSMMPTLRDGDRLLVRGTRRPSALPVGRLAVVQLPGGRGPAVKRLAHRMPDGWWVERDNPTEGTDSALVGTIGDGDVLALVVARLWPAPGRSAARRRQR